MKKVHIRYTPSPIMLAEMATVPVRSISSLVAEKKKAEEANEKAEEANEKTEEGVKPKDDKEPDNGGL